jgi:hypothetical protein
MDMQKQKSTSRMSSKKHSKQPSKTQAKYSTHRHNLTNSYRTEKVLNDTLSNSTTSSNKQGSTKTTKGWSTSSEKDYSPHYMNHASRANHNQSQCNSGKIPPKKNTRSSEKSSTSDSNENWDNPSQYQSRKSNKTLHDSGEPQDQMP